MLMLAPVFPGIGDISFGSLSPRNKDEKQDWFSGKRCCKFVTEKGPEVWRVLSLIMSSFSLSFNMIVFLILRSGRIEIKTFHCGIA